MTSSHVGGGPDFFSSSSTAKKRTRHFGTSRWPGTRAALESWKWLQIADHFV
jgi:hypothetical protein